MLKDMIFCYDTSIKVWDIDTQTYVTCSALFENAILGFKWLDQFKDKYLCAGALVPAYSPFHEPKDRKCTGRYFWNV